MSSVSVPSVSPRPQTSFAAFAPLPDRLPCPYTSAPDAHVLEAQRRLIAMNVFPEGFIGRAGVLLTAEGERITATLALDPVREAAGRPWEDTRADAIWPPVEDDAVTDALLVNGLGEGKTLRDIIAEVFAPFPERDDDHGGREQKIRRAQWRGFLEDGLTSPVVTLLREHNARRDSGRPIALAEWWVGPSPAWDIRFDGTFYAPKSGARFLLQWLLTGHPHAEPRPQQDPGHLPELPILYEDDHLIVINKPARLASVPGGSESVSAKSILEARYGELFVIHRLDMGTSGVLAFAKTKEALRPLNKAFSDRHAQKRYIARLEGELPSTFARRGTIALPIALNWFDRPKQAILPVAEGAREALTTYEVLETVATPTGPKTTVALSPLTGRTHQLRMHCAHPDGLGLPIDGDPFYGHGGLLEETRERRLCLHADSLRIVHPMTGEALHIHAPADFPVF